eukprot:COSAG01_NODE_338_length_18671_cov_259.238154_4_plen_63_part_00
MCVSEGAKFQCISPPQNYHCGFQVEDIMLLLHGSPHPIPTPHFKNNATPTMVDIGYSCNRNK